MTELFNSTKFVKEKFLIANALLGMFLGTVSNTPAGYSASLTGTTPENNLVISNNQYLNKDQNLRLQNHGNDRYSPNQNTESIEGNCVRALPNTSVNVRSGPGTEHSIVASIRGNQFITLGEDNPINGWYKAVSHTGEEVWISAQYVQKLSCMEAIDTETPANQIRMPKTMVGNITVFNIDESPLSPEIISRLVRTLGERMGVSPDVSYNGRKMAIVFGTLENMFTLRPELRGVLRDMGRTDPKFSGGQAGGVFTPARVTIDGNLASSASGVGELYDVAFVVTDSSDLSAMSEVQLYNIMLERLIHEYVHALVRSSTHEDYNGGYTEDNLAVLEAQMVAFGTWGEEECEVFYEGYVEACKQYARALYGESTENSQSEVEQ